MTLKVAINGYGRIGRNVLRAHYEGGKKHAIEIVAPTSSRPDPEVDVAVVWRGVEAERRSRVDGRAAEASAAGYAIASSGRSSLSKTFIDRHLVAAIA